MDITSTSIPCKLRKRRFVPERTNSFCPCSIFEVSYRINVCYFSHFGKRIISTVTSSQVQDTYLASCHIITTSRYVSHEMSLQRNFRICRLRAVTSSQFQDLYLAICHTICQRFLPRFSSEFDRIDCPLTSSPQQLLHRTQYLPSMQS